MSLYLKYRPQNLEEVKGNADIKSSLASLLSKREECPHSFLLYGPTGCGKTTIARIIANMLDCKGSDYREIDSADYRGIDMVREVRKLSGFKPIESKCRVWVLDECHKMSNDAQNALLKILEDTPKHVYFILCTTDPKKLIETIIGRCTLLQVKPLSDPQMLSLLKRITREEGSRVDQEVYDIIVNDCKGRPRNAIQKLELVLNVSKDQQLEIAKQAEVEQAQAIDLCRALIKKSSWGEISRILRGLKESEINAEDVRRLAMAYFSAIVIKSDNRRAGLILEMFNDPFYDTGFPQLVLTCYLIYNEK